MDEQALQQRLLKAFYTEADEHVEKLSSALLRLDLEGNHLELVQEMFRAAHSLKGASRAVGLFEIETLCQSLEDLLDGLRKGAISPNQELIDTIEKTTEALKSLLKGQSAATEKLVDDLLCRQQQTKAPAPPSPSLVLDQSNKEIKEKAPIEHTIRVNTSRIDHLLQHVEEMVMIKINAEARVNELKKLETALQNAEKELKKFKKGDVKDENTLLDLLEKQDEHCKHLQNDLAKIITKQQQDRRIIATMIDGVIDDTKEILMQPFRTLTESFAPIVRSLCKSTGKQVQLMIEGEELEIDRRILERLKDPFLHLLRNSIDHGIELPDVRLAKGKEAKGTLKVTAKQVHGNTFEVKLADDGKGLDLEQIKQTALQRGWADETTLSSLDEQQIISFLFEPGFSTAEIITELSGRGVGLDILKKNIEKLAGQIEIKAEKDKGLTVAMMMPLTLSTFRGILFEVSGREFILPTHSVLRVAKRSFAPVTKAENRSYIAIEDKQINYIALAPLLGLPFEEEKIAHILVIKNGQELLACGVDRIRREQEILIKGLDKALEPLLLFSGTTILDWGKVIPLLDPAELFKQVKRAPLPQQKNLQHKNQQHKLKKILIAEDSITSRMLLKNILEAAGYEVKAVVDGIEAFIELTNHPYNLLLSDVEMPRMNGFELTRKVRSCDQLKELPVILCTSRGSREDREEGITAGANAYIDKSSFSQNSLLEITRQLI